MSGTPKRLQKLGLGLSVSWKGFLMVGIPLVLQLVCLAILGWLLSWQHAQVEKHFHCRKMQENMSVMMKAALDSGLSIIKYKTLGDPKFLTEFDQHSDDAHAAMEALKNEATLEEKARVNLVVDDFLKLEDFAKKAKESATSESRLESLGSALYMKKQGGKLATKLQADAAAMEEELMLQSGTESVNKMIAAERQTQILIYGASFMSFLLAFMVHRFFTNSITDRLKILTDNTIRLARSEALHPPDQGADEIAHLDHVFHEMANALAEAAHKERAVIQHAADVICSVDSEGTFNAVSPASLHVFGFAPEELVGTKLFDMVAPEDLTGAHLTFATIRDEETEPQPFETRIKRKDGTFVHILWSAYWAQSEQSMFCVAHDITERKEAEDQLRASEARVRSIFESAPVALVVLDQTGTVKLLNPRAEKIFGYRMEQIIDKHFNQIVPTAQEFDPSSFSRDTLEELVGRVKELEAVDCNGRRFPIELTFDHYQTTEGERYLAAALDVTERHEVERLKREFVSTVSHELRTPLTAIRGSLTLLAMGALGKLGDQADKAVKIAERNCLRLINLINDLLDIEKLEAGKLEMVYEEVSFTPVVDRSLEAVKSFAEQYGVSFETDAACAKQKDAKVLADSDRLVQVLVNLLSNAVKYSPRDAAVTLRVQKQAECLKISIIDKGRGIPEEYKDKLFERFQQVETADSKKRGGTGLGLAICKAIVEQHNGVIGIESELGKGSTFWFEIPLAGSAAAQRLVKKEDPAEQPALVLSVPQPQQQPQSQPTVLKISETNKVLEERS